jgi:hypothetical protein
MGILSFSDQVTVAGPFHLEAAYPMTLPFSRSNPAPFESIRRAIEMPNLT